MIQKFILIIYVVLLSKLLADEPSIVQDSTKSLIFRVFSLDEEDSKKYEKGYIFDRIFKRREFHRTINFIPLEFSYGFGYNVGSGFLGLGTLDNNWMNYDLEVSNFKGGSLKSRIGHQLDIDILKTNLAYYWFGNSWLDMHSGLNFRYSSILFPENLPAEWTLSNASWKDSYKFNAQVYEIGWSQSLILQWFESWYSSYRYTYGLAFSKFYVENLTPSGTGPSHSFSIGARYILDRGLTNRFSVGIDLKYTNISIGRIKDAEDLTPISNFNMKTMGVYVTGAVFFGGQQTKGDIGKSLYYSKDYSSAMNVLEEFVEEYPNHVNIMSAKKLIVESARKIPYQLMRQGMSFDERGMTEKAIERYIRAKTIADTLLRGVIEDRLREIAFIEIEKAEEWISQGFGDTAIAHVINVSDWYPEISHHVKRFKINQLMKQGEQLYKAGLYNRSLYYFNQALEIDPALTFEVGIFKHRIAADLLVLADSLKDVSSLKFIVYALEETKLLAGGLNKTNQKVLEGIKQKLIDKEEFDIRQKIDIILQKKIEEKISNNPIKVGMTISEVEIIMGRPSEILSKGVNDKNQLWIYQIAKREKLYLTFTNYILFRIEEK